MSAPKAAIAGVGSSDYYRRGRSLPKTVIELAGIAVLNAVEDAGLSVRDVDGFATFAGGPDISLLAFTLGIPEVKFTAALTGGGGGSAGSIGLAADAIANGSATVVVSVMAMQQADYRLGRTDLAGGTGPYALRHTSDKDFTLPFGMLSPGHKFAMVIKRHMHLYGTRREDFAELVIGTRNNALTRPNALMKTPLTLDDYFDARMITDPLCLLDFCLENDGAVAIVTTSAERARHLRHQPVDVLSAESGGDGRFGHSVGWMTSPDEYFATSFHQSVAKRLFAKSGLGPDDIDVAELYDHFSPMVLLQLEDYGLCPIGESGSFVSEGNIRWPGGSLPVNTHGGNLSEAYVMGMTHIKEAVEQLRGTAINQVPGARTALVTGGPAAIPVSALILGAS
jgi:acetyl-CoA acetyltransferase